VWNERYSLEVARRARALFPEALIVLGGPSVPRQPQRAEEFLRRNSFADVLAFGEGEVAFAELLRARLDGAPLENIAGLALRTGLTPARARLDDFAATASPYLDGTFDALPLVRAAIIETNRGCPFACTFCDWGQAVASKVNELPMDRLFHELDMDRTAPDSVYLYRRCQLWNPAA